MPPRCVDAAKWWQCLRDLGLGHEAAAGFDPWGLALWGAAAPARMCPPQPPRNMDTFCRPVAPAQQWQHDKSETRSNPR